MMAVAGAGGKAEIVGQLSRWLPSFLGTYRPPNRLCKDSPAIVETRCQSAGSLPLKPLPIAFRSSLVVLPLPMSDTRTLLICWY